jgi:hypothetical protein
MSKTQEAFKLLETSDNNRAFISQCLTSLGGSVDRIHWHPQKTGVSEQVSLSFADGTGMLVNRFLNSTKQLVVKINSL